jgi:hypothetical protein
MTKRARLSHARGAAMVEGIVVVVVMFVFFGMNMWAYKAYGGKIDQASSTRRDALYHASHNCSEQFSGDTDSYTDPSLKTGGSTGASGETVDVGGDPRVAQAAGQSQGAGQAPSTRSGGITTADKSGSVDGKAAVWDPNIHTNTFSTGLHTKSFVWCNQERHDGFLGTFTGAWGAAKGIVDLF